MADGYGHFYSRRCCFPADLRMQFYCAAGIWDMEKGHR